MTHRSRGFTMIEMIAVLAVVAILATLAVPSYLEKIVREQVKGALEIVEVAKPPIAASWRGAQAFPADNAEAGLPPPEKIVANFVSATAVRDGAITIVFGNGASRAVVGKALTVRPAVMQDEPVVPIAWVCGYAEAPKGMTTHGQNETSVPQGLLPLECRSLPR